MTGRAPLTVADCLAAFPDVPMWGPPWIWTPFQTWGSRMPTARRWLEILPPYELQRPAELRVTVHREVDGVHVLGRAVGPLPRGMQECGVLYRTVRAHEL